MDATIGLAFVRGRRHAEVLYVGGTNRSKRFGNFVTARDLREQGVDAAAVRLLFWQTHYRQPLDFNDEALEGAKEGVKRLGELRARLAERAAAEPPPPGRLGVLAGLGGALESQATWALV